MKLDLRSQVQGVLPRVYGGTDNEVGAGTTWLIGRFYNDSGGTLAEGTVVTKTLAAPALKGCTVVGQPIVGVIVGYYPDSGGVLVLGDAPVDKIAAVCMAGFVKVLTTSAAAVGQYLAASATTGKATPATTKPLGSWGYCVQAATSTFCYAHIGNVESTGATPFGTPSLTLGTANAAGSSTSVIRADATLLAFDGTNPSTQAIGDAASVGAATVAARRDHKHAMPGFDQPAISLGTVAAAGAAATLIRTDATIVAFDATVPATQAFSDSPATGSAAYAARRDHKHGMPTSAVGEILIVDTPSTPLVFADLVQNDDQNDLLYAD